VLHRRCVRHAGADACDDRMGMFTPLGGDFETGTRLLASFQLKQLVEGGY
jgi:hypothetical protein